MKHVQACLCPSKDLESNFNHFGCPVAGPTLFKYQEKHTLIGENSFLGLSWLLNRLARSSLELHSGENCFLDHSRQLNRDARASQHLLSC